MIFIRDIKNKRLRDLVIMYCNKGVFKVYLRYAPVTNSRGYTKDVKIRCIEPSEAVVGLQKRVDEYSPSRLGGRAMNKQDHIDVINYLKENYVETDNRHNDREQG